MLSENIPPYLRIRQYVMGLIQKGHAGDVRLQSEHELCRIFNVSRPTVRKALKQLVDDGFLIPRRGRGMGTFINPLKKHVHHAQGKMENTPRVIGIFYGDSQAVHIYDSPFRYIQAVINGINSYGFICRPIYPIDPGSGSIDEFINLTRKTVDAVVAIFPSKKLVSFLKAILSRELPLLIICREVMLKKSINLVVDYEKGGFQAAEALLNKGHDKIVFVHYDSPGKSEKLYNGLIKAYRAKSVSHDPELRISRKCDLESTLNNLLKKRPDITAVITSGGFHAVQTINAIKAAGRSCPENISILFHGMVSPDLLNGFSPTIIEVDCDELSLILGRAITGLMDKKKKSGIITLKPVINKGKTVRKISKEEF